MKANGKHDGYRVAIHLLWMAFGIYTTVFPLVVLTRESPDWTSTILGAEFTVAATLLLFSKRTMLRIAALVVVCIGLTTISLVILTRGEPRALGAAFLFGAFAAQAIRDIHLERDHRRIRAREEARLLHELDELIREGNGR